MPTLL
jgi:hypothetical protein